MMTDLIARLEAHIARADCVCVLRHDFPAILHALKVAEAWEPLYQTVTYGEPKIADHKKFEQAERALVAAVKGEQG